MDKRPTQASKEIIWRDHLARQASSGKSIAAFCRAEAISQANFYAWRTKFRGDVADLLAPTVQPAFIDLGAVTSDVLRTPTHSPAPTPAHRPTPSIDLRIDLGSGVVLTITRR